MSNRAKCIEMWQWMVEHHGSTKEDWAVAHPYLAAEVKEEQWCFACKDVGIVNAELCPKLCPISWHPTKKIHCCHPGSPYRAYLDAETARARTDAAELVLETIKATWKKPSDG